MRVGGGGEYVRWVGGYVRWVGGGEYVRWVGGVCEVGGWGGK